MFTDFLQNMCILTENHVLESPFNKVADLKAGKKKIDSNTGILGIFLRILKQFKKQLFCKRPSVTASYYSF